MLWIQVESLVFQILHVHIQKPGCRAIQSVGVHRGRGLAGAAGQKQGSEESSGDSNAKKGVSETVEDPEIQEALFSWRFSIFLIYASCKYPGQCQDLKKPIFDLR